MDASEKRNELAREQARQVAAFYRELLEGGVDKLTARELAKSYGHDLMFSAVHEKVSRWEAEERLRREPGGGEPWK